MIYILLYVEILKVFSDIKKEVLKDIVLIEDDLILKVEIKDNFENINENI